LGTTSGYTLGAAGSETLSLTGTGNGVNAAIFSNGNNTIAANLVLGGGNQTIATGNAASNTTINSGLRLTGTISGGSSSDTLNFTANASNRVTAITGTANTFASVPVTNSNLNLVVTRLGDATNGGTSSLGTSTTIRLNGGMLTYAGTGETTNRSFDLRANSTLAATGTGGLLTVAGGVSTTTAGAKQLTISPSSSAPGSTIEIQGLVSDGSGTVSLYAGTTSVNVVRLSNAANSFSGGLRIRGAIVETASIGVSAANSPLGTNGTITFGDPAADNTALSILRYTGTGETTSKVMLAGGGAQNVSASGATIIDQGGSGVLEIASNIAYDVANYTRVLDLRATSTTGGTGLFSGQLADNGTGAVSLRKTGAGIWTVSGSNTYTGGTELNAGTLSLGSAGAIGSSGTISFNGGTLQATAINTTDYSSRFSTAASQQYRIDTNSESFTLSSNLSSLGGSFTKFGAGTLTLSGANTYTGTTTINGGVLAVINGAAIADTGAVILADVAGATLTVQNSETIGSLRGGGATGGNVSIASGQTLTVAETGSQTFAGVISNSGSLVKTGAGTLTLSGTNTYTGLTTVSAGQLVVNGSSSGSAHTVGNGATLGGSGTVGALVVQSGGTISPGNSPGILNVVGDTTWENGGNYNWELLDATGAAGTGWDQLAITGVLDLASLTAGGFNVNVWSLSDALTSGNALNFDGIGGIYSWPIATASGGITGFNASNFFINTTAVNGTNGFTNDFTGGTFSMSQTGNNLYLNYLGPTPVPEPGSAFTVLALFSGAVLNRRKRVVKH
jgi:autotransporter-associated beta strand protein